MCLVQEHEENTGVGCAAVLAPWCDFPLTRTLVMLDPRSQGPSGGFHATMLQVVGERESVVDLRI